MNIIYLITFILFFLPIIWVITDLKIWKIKNYFTFPIIFFLLILWFFIEWFFLDINNVLWLIIIFLFWFFFYKGNKWWAWDWKYIIIIWFCLLIISYLYWIESNILNHYFFIVFLLFLLYNIFYLLFNLKKIKKLKFKNDFQFNILDDFYIIGLIFSFVFILWNIIDSMYKYLIIFILIYLFIDFFNWLKLKLIKQSFIFLSFIILLITKDIKLYFTIICMFYFFSYIKTIFDIIYDKIDIKEIEVIKIKQWDILTDKSLKELKEKWINLLQSPLQWNEVFELIKKAKKNNFLNFKIQKYIDIRIGLFFYLWYILTLLYIFIK